MSEKMKRDYYKILYVSQSGKGKTYSFRNMNPDTTGFINIENKPLPFKNKFKYHSRPTTYQEAYQQLITYGRDPNIESIVFDSFSAYVDLLLLDCRKNKKGFDIWNTYAEEIGKILDVIKQVPKEVFVTAHYEVLGLEGVQEKRVKVKGKEWEGLIEKEFTIVLYANNKFLEDNKRPEYFFTLSLEDSSSKCPPEIFGEDVIKIDNDSNFVLEKILEFVK